MTTSTKTHPVPRPRAPISLIAPAETVEPPEPLWEMPEGHRWYDADLDHLTGCPIGAELARELTRGES